MDESRRCNKCLLFKPLDDKHFDTYVVDGKRGFRHKCLDCARQYCAVKMKRLRKAKRDKLTLPLFDTEVDGIKMRLCRECQISKPLNAQNFRKFHREGKRKVGHPACFASTCVDCTYSLGTDSGRRHYAKQMLDNARHRAKRDGLPCTITVRDVVIPENCPVFGFKLEVGDRHNHQKSPTLDKHYPERGYVVGNISVISHEANRIKSNATLEQLKQMVAYMEGLREKETT